MKKLLYFLTAAALMCSCSSNDPEPNPGPGPEPEPGPETPSAPLTGPGSLTFGYCGDDIGFTTGVNQPGMNGTLGGAIYIPADVAAAWKGAAITGVNLGYGTSVEPTVQIFISEKMDGPNMTTPLYTQDAEIELQNDWNEITFDTPYEITGTGFYIGYTTPMLYGNRPLAFDNVLTDINQVADGDYIGVNGEWEHGGPWFGSVCLKVIVSGDNLPLHNIAISDLFIPEFVAADKEFPTDFYVTNKGVEPIENVTISMSTNGKVFAEGTAVADKPIPSGEGAWMTATDLKCTEQGTNMEIVASVTKVNGQLPTISGSNETTGIMSCSDISYEKNVVFEEFTGTWCGYCPRGIVGIEYMMEHYANDGFIAVAGHYNDEMQSSSYVGVVNRFSNGSYPSAVADRTYYFDPSASTLEEYFLYLKQYPSFANIDIDLAFDSSQNAISVNATTEFALDIEGANYGLCFVLCQNNVGPYAQTNYFSGGVYGELGGWEKYGSYVSWIYNEVARVCVGPFGLDNSIPSLIEKGTKYNYSANLNANSEVLDDYYVVAMIIDKTTYRVLNGVKVNMSSDESNATRSFEPSKTLKSDAISRIKESEINKKIEKTQPVRLPSTEPKPSILRCL